MKKKNLTKKILKSDDFLITAHQNPDADAIASLAFLVRYLDHLGKKVYWELDGDISNSWVSIVSDIQKYGYKGEKIENVIFLDCTSKERAQIKYDENAVIYNIDHHESNLIFGDHHYIDTESSSTAEILYDLFKFKGMKRNEFSDLREYLLVGILGDTGFLKYDNTSPKTMRNVIELLGELKVFDIFKKYFMKHTAKHFKFFEHMIAKLHSPIRNVYHIAISNSELNESGLTYDDISDIFSWFRTMKDADVLMFLREFRPKSVRVNFRGNNTYDMNELASYFKGGGHKNASAATIEGSIDEVLDLVITKVKGFV